MDTDVHTIDLGDLYKRFDTNPETGLSEEEAANRLKKNGPNILTPPKQTPFIIRYLKSFLDGFSLMLSVGGIMCLCAYAFESYSNPTAPLDNVYLGCVLLIVVFITGNFTFYQNNKSSKIMDSFKKMIPQESLVIRGGKKLALKASELVVGDIVCLSFGDFIPADIRIIDSKEFKVDNSSLTGESEPQRRHKECTHENLLETANCAIAYTYAVEGTATGIVFATADNTIMGRIAFLTSSLTQTITPIAREINKFIHLITAIAVMLGILFFILGMVISKLSFVAAVVFLIGIIVANVPEGLLVTVTLSLTLTAQKMATKECLVKNLESVETLGSTGVICSDKTGTLTQNKMLVNHIWCNNDEMLITQKEDAPRKHDGFSNSVHQAISICAANCNRAEFRVNQPAETMVNHLLTNGDASETALIKYIEQFVAPLDSIRKDYPKVFEIPFNSTNKYQVSIHTVPNESRYLLLMKGAPERIVERCSTMLLESGEITNDAANKELVAKANENLANRGERVLGFAHYWLPEDQFPIGCEWTRDDEPTFPLNGLCFLGLISLMDPPRDAVPEAVRECRSAGIRVVMVTGDHPLTAKAIARTVGIIGKNSVTVDEIMKQKNLPFEEVTPSMANAVVITGGQLKDMTNEQLDCIVSTYEDIVFARTSPQQKLLIVEGFQRQGYVVAVTGDGVNDSPALRKADIGVAMGIAGSDVAKQAADMILLNDDFANIVLGVEEGRLIFDNLKKSIAYTLTSNIPEILPFLLNILIGIPLMLGTITILMIDLGTDMFPAISLAYETAESDIMKRKPRNPKKDRLVNSILINYSYLLVGIWQAVNGVLIYFFIMMYNGFYFAQLKYVTTAWSNPNVQFVTDSYGQEWSYAARKDLEYTCHSAYFFSTVILQIADLLISKTRLQSIFSQGIFNNLFMLIAIHFEVALGLVLIYWKPINIGLMTRPVHPRFFILSVINAFLLFIVDEARRAIMRKNPGGFIERETYY